MSHFSIAPATHDGLSGLAVSRLPQFAELEKHFTPPASEGPSRAIAIDAAELRALLAAVFGPGDHILFETSAESASGRAPLGPGGERLLRVDGPSPVPAEPASLKRLIAALGLAQAKTALGQPDWVVLVADRQTLDFQQALDLLAQCEELHRFLLVWCGAKAPATGDAEQTLPSAAEASRLPSTEQNPQNGSLDAEHLADTLRRLKAQSHSAVLDLDTRQILLHDGSADSPRGEDNYGNDPSPGLLAATTNPTVSGHDALERQLSGAPEALLRLLSADHRVVILAADAPANVTRLALHRPDRYFELPVADADALVWCAGLAAGGCRPVLCISSAALARCLPALVAEICRPQHPVTLFVLPSGAADDESASALSLMRLLADTPLLVPRDGDDFDRSLAFALAYDGPAAIWCPEPALFGREAENASTSDARQIADRLHWQFGRAEVIGSGTDVALIGWGSVAAAAERAAELLARSGLKATVVSARFLQPLDREAIVTAARSAAACLVLDDPQARSGFAAEVLERLAEAGVATPTSVEQLNNRHATMDLDDARDRFALAIVDRCRWLAEPLEPERRVAPNWAITPAQPLAGGAACTAAQAGWLQMFGSAAVDIPGGEARRQRWPQSLPSLPTATPAQPAPWTEFDLASEQRLIAGVGFSDELGDWIRRYEVVGKRNVYLWRWCLHGLRLTTLPCVEPALRASLCETKLLAVMLGVMLDDIADLGGNRRLLKLLNLAVAEDQRVELSGFDAQEQAYGEFTLELAAETWQRLRQYPRYEQFLDVLVYDHRQIVNAMEYSSLLNEDLTLVNLVEHDAYSPHNMQMMSFATMDLMGSSGFDRRELGRLRALVWHAQSMGRIGNLLSTWQREVRTRDFTSGVFARALEQGDLQVDDLKSASTEVLERTIECGNHDTYFIDRWRFHQRAIQAIVPRIRSVDLRPLLAGLERLIAMELGSRGLK